MFYSFSLTTYAVFRSYRCDPSAASAVRRLPSRVRTATPVFDVRSSTRRAFSVAGPAAWNSLPDCLRSPSSSVDSFRRALKSFLFSFY